MKGEVLVQFDYEKYTDIEQSMLEWAALLKALPITVERVIVTCLDSEDQPFMTKDIQ